MLPKPQKPQSRYRNAYFQNSLEKNLFPKAKILKNGDAIAGYVTYTGNMQFEKGTGVTTWYVGSGYNGDIDPHHTKLVKVKFFFKNSKGKVKTKTVKKNSAHISTKLINGYTPYKATVWYRTY